MCASDLGDATLCDPGGRRYFKTSGTDPEKRIPIVIYSAMYPGSRGHTRGLIKAG